MADIPELGRAAAAERTQPEEEVIDVIEAKTAFLVFTTPEGNTVLTADINAPISVERPPTSHEVKGALYVVLSDFAVSETALNSAQMTINTQMQMAQRARGATLTPQEQAALAATAGMKFA